MWKRVLPQKEERFNRDEEEVIIPVVEKKVEVHQENRPKPSRLRNLWKKRRPGS
jgi:hypothetical protein